jgi:hypothetical protein
MQAPVTGVVLWAPTEVQKLEDLEWEEGWWISSTLKWTRPGERLVIYRTGADQGIAAIFDVATEPIRAGGLGYAAYGRPYELSKPILLEDLQQARGLNGIFGHRQGRFYLRAEQAERVEALLPTIPWQTSEDPVPKPGDPDWEWRPMDRWWGIETHASDAIARHEPAWSTLGFVTPPERERKPHSSLLRTDLKGTGRERNGINAEVKHFVAKSTLEQLERYLREARGGGGVWAGHLVALTAYTQPVARQIDDRSDVALWLCERDDDGNPEPVCVAGRRHPRPR